MPKILTPFFTALLLCACVLNGETGACSNVGQAKTHAEQKTKTPAIGLTSEPSIVKSRLLASIKDGGYIIYFRHTTTERDYADQADPLMSLDDCSSQRKLSTQGIKESYEIGMAFALKEIPVGEIIVSEYCRSWKTANLAFGEWTKKDSRLIFLSYKDYTKDTLH